MLLIVFLLAACIYPADSTYYQCLQQRLSPETKLCVLLIANDVGNHKAHCEKSKFKYFADRMDDERYRKFRDQLIEFAKEVDWEVFIGMTKDSAGNSERWHFENDEGSIEEDDYPFWDKKPMYNEKCAYMKVAKNDSKVIPSDCRIQRFGFCEKKGKGCSYTKDMHYVKYFGRCVSYEHTRADYSKIKSNYCKDGYIMPIKDDKDMEIAKTALYLLTIGTYAGLRKQDGKWIYDETGVEETERFLPEDAGDGDCAYYGLKKNGEIALFTADCRTLLVVLCESKNLGTRSSITQAEIGTSNSSNYVEVTV